MKNIIYLFIIIIIAGCNKSSYLEEPILKPNSALTIHSSELVDIRAMDVFATKDSLKRKIEIIDRINNTVSDIFYITLKSSDFTNNIFTQLKNKTFTGNLSIVNNNEILFLREVKNGVNIVSSSNQRGNIKSNAVEKCNYDVVRACVNSKFENMNFIELAICVSELPACYVGVWAICGWDKCIAPLYQKQISYL